MNNFPQETILETIQLDGRDFFSISYQSTELVETPFGQMPLRAFSTGNHDLQTAINTFTQTLEANKYNFETKTFN